MAWYNLLAKISSYQQLSHGRGYLPGITSTWAIYSPVYVSEKNDSLHLFSPFSGGENIGCDYVLEICVYRDQISI